MRGRENVTLLLLGVGKGNEIMLSFVSCFLKISFSTLLSASWFRVEAPKKKKKKATWLSFPSCLYSKLAFIVLINISLAAYKHGIKWLHSESRNLKSTVQLYYLKHN